MGARCGSLEPNCCARAPGQAISVSVHSGNKDLCCGPARCSSCFTASDGSTLSAGSAVASASSGGESSGAFSAPAATVAPSPGQSGTEAEKAAFGGAFSKSPAPYVDEEIRAVPVIAQPVVQEPVVRPKPTGGKKPSAALSSAIGKIKSAALGTAAELKEFRKFLKPLYTTPGEAYDDLAGLSSVLDRATFVRRLEELKYPGNGERLFNGLREGDVISREAFKQRLVAVGRTPAPNKNKKLNFGSVVVHAVEVMKAERAEAAAKEAAAKEAAAAAAAASELSKTANVQDASEGTEAEPRSPPSAGSRWKRSGRNSSNAKEDAPARRHSNSSNGSNSSSKPPPAPEGRKRNSKSSGPPNQDVPAKSIEVDPGLDDLANSLEYSFDDPDSPTNGKTTYGEAERPVRAA